MNNHEQTPKKSLLIKQDKDNKLSLLKAYIKKHKYIDIQEQPKVCESFGLSFQKNVFGEVYKERFYNYLLEKVTTVATAERETGIPQKYLTTCKTHYQKLGLLNVVAIGQCPTTKSRNVQFVTTNPLIIQGKQPVVINNQLNLFE